MSFIDTKNYFEKIDRDFTKQETRPTTYSISNNLFQLNSYTDDDHKKSGHASQTLQLDLIGLKDILRIIEEEFPNLSGNIEANKIDSFVESKNYTENELAGILKSSYENADSNMQVASIHMFGIAYGKYIIDKFSASSIIEKAGLNKSYSTELSKGINIYKCLATNKFPISITQETNNHVPIKNTSFKLFDGNKNFEIKKITSTFSTHYITALLAKPFVILTGNFGTGKTKIAADFAKWLEKKTDTGFTNHLTVPVGADWTDNSKILGYFNPLANNGTGEYVKTEILTLIEAANDNPDIPFFLILDEMNLSHVERYFADFLSTMESGKPILLYKKPENCESTVPEKIYLPKNLFVTGTVNIDETTYMFSPKVLDRANVIEFKPEQDSVLSLLKKKSGNTDIVPDNNGMAEAFINLANDVRTADYDFSDEKYKPLSESFKSLYDILEPSGFEFAYRTTKEIALYVSACQKLNSDFKLMESIDEQLLQKILPKIHGNRKQIGTLLEKLETFCAEKSLPLSLAKVQKMKVRLENYQYASFI